LRLSAPWPLPVRLILDVLGAMLAGTAKPTDEAPVGGMGTAG
jgi:TRAP-type mannitol/chloroaromatic compound transport system permease large subunit